VLELYRASLRSFVVVHAGLESLKIRSINCIELRTVFPKMKGRHSAYTCTDLSPDAQRLGCTFSLHQRGCFWRDIPYALEEHHAAVFFAHFLDESAPYRMPLSIAEATAQQTHLILGGDHLTWSAPGRGVIHDNQSFPGGFDHGVQLPPYT
jgi:hypothetical protein